MKFSCWTGETKGGKGEPVVDRMETRRGKEIGTGSGTGGEGEKEKELREWAEGGRRQRGGVPGRGKDQLTLLIIVPGSSHGT